MFTGAACLAPTRLRGFAGSRCPGPRGGRGDLTHPRPLPKPGGEKDAKKGFVRFAPEPFFRGPRQGMRYFGDRVREGEVGFRIRNQGWYLLCRASGRAHGAAC